MSTVQNVSLISLALLLSCACALGQRKVSTENNAALRYWSAFSELQDSGVTDQQAKELNAILDGTSPYDDLKYKDLLEKNQQALEVMHRGTSLPECDWGLDYGLGADIPVEYARKALVFGRLNVLYAFHLFFTGDKDGGVRALVAGIRFSRDVGNGGSFFANLIAKSLLDDHLRAIAGAVHSEHLSDAQRLRLRDAVARVRSGLDWRNAAKLDLEALRSHYTTDPQASAAVTRIIPAYTAALADPSKLPALAKILDKAPRQIVNSIPSAKKVLEQKQDLDEWLRQARSLLR